MLISNEQLTVPALGQGTWHMGESVSARKAEVAALQAGLDLGLIVIDTAEMYANGAAEQVVGQAIKGRREEVFLVSKVLPSHAAPAEVHKACDRSRRHLGVDRIDLYLLHWASTTPLEQTIDAFEALRAKGAIGAWGVSNFDVSEMFDLLETRGGDACVTNQVYYSLGARGIEFDLLPMMRQRQIAAMAYCPLDQGALADHAVLRPLAQEQNVSCAQLALAWLLHQPGVITIPKSSSVARVTENAAARQISLTRQDLAQLDAVFAPPTRAQGLKIV